MITKAIPARIYPAIFFALVFSMGIQSWTLWQGTRFFRVVGVKDGDTIVLLSPEKESVTVRLAEIDAPERKQAYGTVSRTFLSDLIFGKEVRLEKSGTDRYGRTLGFIYTLGGVNVNVEMVRQGMAWQFLRYSNSEGLRRAQAAAKTSRLGLWKDPYPVPPWEFRRR